jgi:hypothetical protein
MTLVVRWIGLSEDDVNIGGVAALVYQRVEDNGAGGSRATWTESAREGELAGSERINAFHLK